jgi:hypothetical protein
MAKISFSFFICGLILLSCSSKKSDTETTVDSVSQKSTNAIPFQEGTYTTEDLIGEITIESPTATSFNFSILVTTANANCIGELQGTATFDATTQKWAYQDTELQCILTFESGEGIITITETGNCDSHGAACSYNGVYGKTGTFSAANEEPLIFNSILDYYLALPDESFTCEITRAYNKAQRKKAIQYKNIANGFMKVSTDEFENIEIALFKNKQTGKSYLAFVYECGAGCMCTKRLFLEYDNNEWIDRYADFFPDLSQLEENDTAIALKLPEKGTTITVTNFETGEALADLLWKGNKFELSGK